MKYKGKVELDGMNPELYEVDASSTQDARYEVARRFQRRHSLMTMVAILTGVKVKRVEGWE